MLKTRKTFTTIVLSVLMCVAVAFGVMFSKPQTAPMATVEASTTYATKDIAMMGRIAGWYGNGNFEIRLTLGASDWSGSSVQKNYAGTGDLPSALRAMDFFNHIKLGEKTLAEWGCTTCYDNWYKLNSGEPDYTLTIPLAMGSNNMAAAAEAGIRADYPVTILEGALIPSDAYLQGDTTATVYRAGCDYVTTTTGLAYGIKAVAKTEVESVKYVQGHDGNNGYFGVSLKGDDYAGDGTTAEWNRGPYGSDEFRATSYINKLLVNGVAGKAGEYGLFNLGSKGQGYYSFAFYSTEAETETITIPAGTLFPSYAMNTLYTVNGNPVYMYYETQTDVTFYKENDEWVKPLVEKETSVSSVLVDGSASDNFTVIFLGTHDYPTSWDNYGGSVVRVKDFCAKTNFFSHVLIDGVALGSTGEAYINVWGNKGSIAFRNSKGMNTKEITILAGCQFPTRAAVESGEREVYVTTEDITFVKDANGNWVVYVPEGDFDTAVTQVQFGRSTNVLNINLSVDDYPAPDGNNSATYNIGADAEKVLALNTFDNIVVDGYTLRSMYDRYGAASTQEPWIWINKFVGHNFALRIPSADGKDIGAKKIIIRAGTQFPSKSYLETGKELYYVTTEEFTYIRVSDNKEDSWARQSKITFVANGKTIATLPYTTVNGIEGTIPDVPAKAGYKGAWESYTLTGENITVNANYTAHSFTETDTSLLKMEFEAGFLIVYLSNHDYSSAGDTADVKGLMPNLHFYDYLIVDGKKMSDGLRDIDGAFLNIWNRGGSFATYLPAHYDATTSVELKAGCQIPSNANRLDGNNKSCFVLTEDVTFIKDGEAWVKQSNGNGSNNDGSMGALKPNYENDYILSDLYQTGYPASVELEKGYLFVDSTTAGNVYGYNVSQSFSLTFDFSLNLGNSNIEDQGNYTTFDISMSTRGYNWSKGFGWNFYLYRPGNTQKCVELHYGDTSLGTIESLGVFEKGVTYRVTLGYKLIDVATGTVETYVNINGTEEIRTYVLGADYMKLAYSVDAISFSTNSAIKNGVRISDPGFTDDDSRHTITLQDGENVLAKETAWKYTLPKLSAYDYVNEDHVFIGWTTDTATLNTLYPAGYEMELTSDITLYPVWMYMNMRIGAAVRTTEKESGIRFLVDVSGEAYQLGVSKNLIVGAGTLVVPTSYLGATTVFEHATFPEGYFVDIGTEKWTQKQGDVWTYAAALTNISPAQYTRAMSARGYLKIAYTDGSVEYVYTAYSKDLHSRSIYDVATAAYNDNQRGAAVLAYVNNVADITINGALQVSKNVNSVGDYTVTAVKEGNTVTITINKTVKAALINGTRLLAGYSADITIGGTAYEINSFKLGSNGTVITFTVDTGATEDYYASIAEYYQNSNEYTAEHKNEILSILEAWGGNYTNAAKNEEYVARLESVKTQLELYKNIGETKLSAPVLRNGLGYTVVWDAVPNADYYLVTDDNDYRNGVYVLASEELSYKTEVVGKHNVTVTAYSFYEEYATSNVSASFAALEVKPVYSYKAMSDGLYKFDKDAMSTMGLGSGLNTKNDGTSYYYDDGQDMYFAYYNKHTGWSKDQGAGTDWTSPAEFPAHAANLKAMGNNLILISENTNASYKASDVWESSRMKYVMDAAWELGMKVIVCDDVLYNLSKEAGSQQAAASTIANRNGFTDYVTHPAFYGFSLEDEPEMDEIDNVAYTVKALKDACSKLGLSKANGNEPFFLACLYQKNVGFTLSGNYDTYLSNWVSKTGLDYLYVDLYTGHAMGDSTNRYKTTYEAVYKDSLGVSSGNVKFYQVLTAHTQNKGKEGKLLEQDLYMSMLYAAAHNVAGYSWFCYFPISGETAGSMVGFDGNGYGNGIGNAATTGYSYYNAAAKAGYQYELIQGLFNGYKFSTRNLSALNVLTTTLTNGSSTITMYVNADVQSMSANKTAMASGSECYLVGYGLDEGEYYRVVTSGEKVTLAPGQALICKA